MIIKRFSAGANAASQGHTGSGATSSINRFQGIPSGTRDSMTDLLFPVVLSIVVIVVLYNSIRIA